MADSERLIGLNDDGENLGLNDELKIKKTDAAGRKQTMSDSVGKSGGGKLKGITTTVVVGSKTTVVFGIRNADSLLGLLSIGLFGLAGAFLQAGQSKPVYSLVGYLLLVVASIIGLVKHLLGQGDIISWIKKQIPMGELTKETKEAINKATSHISKG